MHIILVRKSVGSNPTVVKKFYFSFVFFFAPGCFTADGWRRHVSRLRRAPWQRPRTPQIGDAHSGSCFWPSEPIHFLLETCTIDSGI
jgi:hypothetical protein